MRTIKNRVKNFKDRSKFFFMRRNDAPLLFNFLSLKLKLFWVVFLFFSKFILPYSVNNFGEFNGCTLLKTIKEK